MKKKAVNVSSKAAGHAGAPPTPANVSLAAKTAPGPKKSLWRDLFGIDPRSLATFRIAIGALLLSDLAIRAGDLQTMYTDNGMFSRVEICRRVGTIWNWSFHFGSGEGTYQAVLFGISAVLALALMLGFQTRLAALASWLMLVSLQHRVPPILSGADLLLRMLLLWGIFLPLGRVWSIDRFWQERRGTPQAENATEPALSVASAAILLQMAMMYFFSAIFKSNPVWFRGETIAGAMAHDFYASPLGASVLHFPKLMMVGTWGTLLLEWVAPVLFFSPWFTARLRVWFVAWLAAMHLAIGILLEVDLFSPVSMAGLTLFLPAEFWNHPWLARFSRAAKDTQPAPGRITDRPRLATVPNAVCLVLLAVVLVVNVNGLAGHPLAALSPDDWKPFTTGLGLGQKWNMFEEVPSKSGWYVGRAKLKDGSEVDLLRQGRMLDWNKPKFPAGLYPNHRWRKLFREMAYDDEIGFQWFRMPVAEFLCRDWNARSPADKQVDEFDLVFCMENRGKSVTQAEVQSLIRERLAHLDFRDSTIERLAARSP